MNIIKTNSYDELSAKAADMIADTLKNEKILFLV